MSQIDKEIPIPFLLLRHKNKVLDEYIWHWFIIAGYKKTYDDLLVKVITYGKYEWISFKELWDNGYEQKGGMIIVDLQINTKYLKYWQIKEVNFSKLLI